MSTPAKVKVVHNQPYDESVEISDGEEVASTNPTPRGQYSPQDVNGQYSNNDKIRQRSVMYDEEEEEDDQESNESEYHEADELTQMPIVHQSGYDPAEYDHLQVSTEIKDLFQYITRYTPQPINLESRLMPFIPEYIPAIGDIDAFIKVTKPDGIPDSLGLSMLDEPSTKQSDPNVLDLQLRTYTKQSVEKPAPVHSIQNPEAESKTLNSWIENIKELHRQKPATNVHYTRYCVILFVMTN
jgi:intraflagellar transport protein 46